MKLYLCSTAILLLALSACSSSTSDAPATAPTSEGSRAANKPNIIYILADDLGYGELGVMGQEIIETPHIDALANGGMLFTQHYSGAPVCAPARGVLMMGRHTGHAYVRGNHEDGARGDVWNFQAMLDNPRLEGQAPIPDSLITLGEVLQGAGYTTGLIGKWGLGAPYSEGVPNKQGFNYFFGYNCQRQAHNLYPTHLWENESRVFLNNELKIPHVKREQDEDTPDSTFFNEFLQQDFAPDAMQVKALEFVRKNTENPFFLYYASPLPHVPLQAPQRWVDHYREKIAEDPAYRGKAYFPSQYPRATYAAMISTLDEQVGELVAELKVLGLYDNTLIIFSSDNGPTYAGGADTEFFKSAEPFQTTKNRIKGHVYEGGIRVPMIAHWPGTIAADGTSYHISAFQDVMPTLAEIAGVEPPANDGISFLPAMKGEAQPAHDYLYWEFPAYKGQQAVRKGNWKAIRKNMFGGNLALELYDLSKDVKEANDVAADNPDIVAEMEAILKREHVTSSVERFRFAVLGE
jgi:arylsulfatase A-like enzyme